jgi:hypothetical protein
MSRLGHLSVRPSILRRGDMYGTFGLTLDNVEGG